MTGSRLATSPEPRHRWWRRIGFGVVVVVAALAGPALAAFLAIPVAAQVVYPPRLASTPAPVTAPRPPAINPDKPTAVFVLSAAGTNIADSLGPYEVFASTGAMNVVTAAATAEPVALTGGVDLVPDFTFDDLARRLPGPPDVIVVPELAGSPTVVVDWLTGEHRGGAPLIMSVCVGAEWLAQAGLLDARPATSNWLGLIGLRRSHPEVNWTDGVRFVDDGRIITTGAVLSGIDGSIRAVERILGPTAAQRVADELHWPGYRPGQSTSIPVSRLAPTDVVALLSAAYRWDRPATGVLLTDGVGEIELASAFRPYTTLSWVAALTSVTRDGEPVRTRHGLTLYPRGAWATVAPTLDRLIVPGHQAAVSHPSDNLPGAPPTVYLHEQAGFPFDGSLRDIASTYDGSTARWVAKSLQYPTPALAPGPVWPWMPTIRLTLLAALGVGAVLLSRWLWISTRRRVAPQSPDDPHVRRQTPAPMLTTRRAGPLPQRGQLPSSTTRS